MEKELFALEQKTHTLQQALLQKVGSSMTEFLKDRERPSLQGSTTRPRRKPHLGSARSKTRPRVASQSLLHRQVCFHGCGLKVDTSTMQGIPSFWVTVLQNSPVTSEVPQHRAR